jgi:argininosuccinate lyase/amino-acid N-acetyltransferase
LILADLEALELAFIENATRNSTTLLPAYTHLRRAQPIRWADYCLAYVEMFKRDHARFAIPCLE